MARPPTQHSSSHEQTAALYALGLLDGLELAAFERHLAECPRCRDVVDRDRETVDQLDTSVPERDPGPQLKARLLAQLAPNSTGYGTNGAVVQHPAERRIAAGALALPVAAALVCALIFGYLLGQSAALGQELTSVQLTRNAGNAGSVLVTVHRSGSTECTLSGLAEPPPGQMYQAWIVSEEGRRLPVGSYDEGEGSFSLQQSALGRTLEITLESASSAQEPTGTPLFSGFVSS
jgi:anti-sigma-K factor RskA